MRIRFSNSRGSLTLAMVIIVATITVVAVGSYMVYKMQRRVNEINNQRLQQLTNEINNFSADAQSQFSALTGDTNSIVITSITMATQNAGVAAAWIVETSTNLVDWDTLLQTDDPAEADNTVSTNIQSASEPMRFFRTYSQ